MKNELICKLIGTFCTLSTGAWGSAVQGKIVAVTDNWIEVETKKGIQLVNADYVSGIEQRVHSNSK